ncbi:NAD(P)-binding domain-containing protein [Actinoplanes couchii]|uniref:Pyridine nucleotide-disulfide oxidoreductase n=1 Tax=Actinoplanes couchii TaxID=403638 RepID=A0ABQ3XET1_9ACTN|nr:NAD(P)-binding domain-containing protein [Actinoplanes couchii]MDR6319865.1 thioredoxin reductase [Actinoplanes couchii]GID56999.1 pyridine nucleotide-disulfide oxidoreductase [Actinoplanes couchii]
MPLDYVIIGAGPAGLQLAALLEADGRRDYLVLEAADRSGAFFTRYPRHRTLISVNKPHTGTDDPELNLRLDWNSLLSDDPELLFTRYTERYFPDADTMVRYLGDFAERTGIKVRYHSRVTRISKDGDLFTVAAGDQVYTARRVVVATGVSQLHRPDIPGFELAEGYDTMSTDPHDYLDQRVLILGKGNSAFETADNLMETTTVIHVAGPSSVRLAWRTHFVGHLRAVNNNFLDTYQLKSANAILDGTVKKIERDGAGFKVTFSFARVNEVVKELHYDRILACTGFRFDASVFDESCRPELTIDDRFPAQTEAWESVNVPGLFFAGTISQVRDFKKSTSGFIHGFRYAVRALHRILEDAPWPAEKLDRTPEAITDAVITRVNRTSALWQQFGFLADVVTVGEDSARYHDEVPVEWFARHGLATPDHDYHDAFVITLEYGPDHDKVDPFDIGVARIAQDTPGQAHDAAYLHPVVRHYRDGALANTHHLAENLENQWDRPEVHVKPLAGFVARVLG